MKFTYVGFTKNMYKILNGLTEPWLYIKIWLESLPDVSFVFLSTCDFPRFFENFVNVILSLTAQFKKRFLRIYVPAIVYFDDYIYIL